MSGPYSENALVAQPVVAAFAALGWTTVQAYSETFLPGGGSLGRETASEVVLRPRLRAALDRLNPGLPAAVLDEAIRRLTEGHALAAPLRANRDVYNLIRDGVRVRHRAGGTEAVATVRVIDWTDSTANDWLLVSQLWVAGDPSSGAGHALYGRRPALVGFVNGLPLLLVEFKAPHISVQDAYTGNLRDYQATIPHLFPYNAFVILTNGVQSRLGPAAAPWEHFAEWPRVATDDEPATPTLDTLIRGTCAPPRFLDLVEHFILFSAAGRGLVKILGKTHQVLGVNQAMEALRRREDNGGRLGMFWHSQGSGKTLSMVFLVRKVLRTLPDAWTFLVVTDRADLDRQVYNAFVAAGVVTAPEAAVRAPNGAALRRLLDEDHRVLFTLIQGFATRPAAPYSARDNLIVLADEVHRPQYDAPVRHMHLALPRAAFLGFTGTPLLAGEAETRRVFGDYVSIYHFQQAIADGITVPLYYENRIPALQLPPDDLDAILAATLDPPDLDETQEHQFGRALARQYHLITREARIDSIAADLVAHFLVRGRTGKALVVVVDSATAVRLYDKVQRHWQAARAAREARLPAAMGAAHTALEHELDLLRTTDMAVIISPSQNEGAALATTGLDIGPHLMRMQREDLETRFKDPADPLRLVFVCSRWIAGFDAPSVSTIYLDKPLRNHPLMQTITRANRVFGDKQSGLIVDYIGVFRNLPAALAIYAGGTGGAIPVQEKSVLLVALRDQLAGLTAYCRRVGVEPDALPLSLSGFALTLALRNAVNALSAPDALRQGYVGRTTALLRLYHALLPDPRATVYADEVRLFAELARQILADTGPVDISGELPAFEALLDESIAPSGYLIAAPRAAPGANPYHIDFAALADQFAGGQPNIATQRLRGSVQRQLADLVRLNRTRAHYQARFQELIDAYNAGTQPVEWLFAQLSALKADLDGEAQRAVAEQLSEEALALFDLLTTQPAPALSAADRAAVKQVAQDLPAILKRDILVRDWRLRPQARAGVRTAIEEALARLPQAYDTSLSAQKCAVLYEHVYESYAGPDRSIYTA